MFYRGAEYLLAKQPFPWEDVNLACMMMGAHLLSVHSKEELRFIRERMGKVCTHTHTLTHGPTHALTHTVRRTCRQSRSRANTSEHTLTHTHSDTHTHAHTHADTVMHTLTHTHTSRHEFTHTSRQVHTRTPSFPHAAVHSQFTHKCPPSLSLLHTRTNTHADTFAHSCPRIQE